MWEHQEVGEHLFVLLTSPQVVGDSQIEVFTLGYLVYVRQVRYQYNVVDTELM
ncbi:hypothetical protein D3C86_2260110 [compost metagenome]